MKRRGFLFVISAPSGTGKSTLSKKLLLAEDTLQLSISMTTRAPRLGEQNGLDYHFVSHSTFQKGLDQNAFLEYAQVFDNYYGTPKRAIEEALPHGYDVLLDIDWQGKNQIVQQLPRDVVTVFILPPSLSELQRRMVSRGLDDPGVIEKRLAKALAESQHAREYDYVLINDDLDQCFAQLQMILKAERQKRLRQAWLPSFLKHMG